MAAASTNECIPEFTALKGSIKCCKGNTKSMKIIIQVTDVNECLDAATSNICITSVVPDTGNWTIGTTTWVPDQCTTVDGIITVFLYDVSNCTVNLLVNFTIDGGPVLTTALKSDNISDSSGECTS